MAGQKRKPKAKRDRKSKRGQNEGSILKVAGRWRAVIPARHSPNGQRTIVYGSTKNGTNTRDFVAQKLAEALAGRRGIALNAARDTLKSFLVRWLDSVAARIAPKTLESYTDTVNNLIIPAIGGVKLQALEPHHVVALMNRLRSEKRAVRSVAYARSILRIALNDAKRWHLVSRNVADREYVDPPRIPKAEVDAHNAETVALILSKVADAGDRLMLRTIATFGLRIGETLGLKWKDIDFEAKRIHVTRAVQWQKVAGRKERELVFVEVKTSRSRRALLMPDSLVTELKEHRRAQLERKMKLGANWHDEDLVFPASQGTKMDARNALRILHRAERAAGVDVKGLHKLRNSAATILLTQGVPLDVVSDILGHSSIRVTKDTYAQFVIARQEQAAAVMDDIFSAKS